MHREGEARFQICHGFSGIKKFCGERNFHRGSHIVSNFKILYAESTKVTWKIVVKDTDPMSCNFGHLNKHEFS